MKCLLCTRAGIRSRHLMVDGEFVTIWLCFHHNLEYFAREGWLNFGKTFTELELAYRSQSSAS